MPRFPLNALFKEASREIKLAAARNFSNSDYGKLIKEVERAYRQPTSEAKIAGILRKFKGLSPRRALDQIAGSDFASVVRTVEQYGRRGGLPKSVIAGFLKSLGPAGNILKALALSPKTDLGYRNSLNDAVAMIRAFGGEVLLPKGQGTVQDVNRGIEAAIQRLQEIGYTVTKVGEPGTSGGRVASKTDEGIQPTGSRKTVDLEMASGLQQRFGPNHPIVTGDMVPTPGSTNVYEFGYDYEHTYLYVRFKGHGAPKEHVRPNSPGPLYRYAHVTPEEFLSLYKLRNHSGEGGGPGDWVWDHLRERGTVSGHQKDYELVGIMDGHVPRKATVRKNAEGKLEEWFVPRMVRNQHGKWLRSRYKEELAPTSGFMVGEKRGGGGGQRTGRYSPRG